MSLPQLLLQQLMPVVEQHLVPVVKADPRGCGKVVDIMRLEWCL
ncbi:hypothetical protein AB6813_21670 [bacterium RCC_150]